MATTYNFDPSGTLVSNRIIQEQHNITSAVGKEYIVVIPKAAPFFPDDGNDRFVVKRLSGDGSSSTRLVPGIDFMYTHKFDAYSRQYPADSVYGSFILLDTEFNGTIEIEYQTLGGEFVLSESQIMEILGSTLVDPRTVSWDDLVNVPVLVDPVSHTHTPSNFIGYGDMVNALKGIGDKLTTAYSSFKDQINGHVKQSDPHKFIDLTKPSQLVEGNKYYDWKHLVSRKDWQTPYAIAFNEQFLLEAGDIVEFDMTVNNADNRQNVVIMTGDSTLGEVTYRSPFIVRTDGVEGGMGLDITSGANTYYGLDGDSTDLQIPIPQDGVAHTYSIEVGAASYLANIARADFGENVTTAPITNIKVIRDGVTILSLRNTDEYISHVLPMTTFMTTPTTVTVKTGGSPITAIAVHGASEETMSGSGISGIAELLLDEPAIVYFTFNPDNNVWEFVSQ